MPVDELYNEVLRLAYINVPDAGQAAGKLRELAEAKGDPYSKGQSLRADGHVHYVSGRHADAVSCYESAVAAFDGGKFSTEIGRTLLSGLQALAYLGRYGESTLWAARARSIFESSGDRLRLARLKTNEANILYRRDHYEEAIDRYTEAHSFFLEQGQGRDLAAVLSNLAVAAIAKGDFDSALDYYRQGRQACVANELPILAAAADYNIAYLYFLRGDYLEATRLYAATRERCASAGDQYHLALCDLDESELYLELNLGGESERLARRAESRFATLNLQYERAKAAVNRALAAAQRQDYSAARSHFRTARKIFLAENNSLWPGLIDFYLASFELQQGRIPQARRALARASRPLRACGIPSRLLAAEILQARIELAANRLDLAVSIARKSAESLKAFTNPVLRFQTLVTLAQILERLGELRPALAQYLLAKDEIETLRNHLWSEDLKMSVLEDKESAFEGLCRIELQLDANPAQLFDWIEESKSRTLIDLLLADASSAPAPSENLRRELHWHYRQLEITALLSRAGLGDTNSSRIAWLEGRISELETSLSRLARPSPVTTNRPANLEVVRHALGPDATLVNYFSVGGKLHALLADDLQTLVIPLADTNETARHFHLLQFQMAKFRLGSPYAEHFAPSLKAATDAHLRTLYNALIAPLLPYLRRPHLLFAPHGFLHNLPFAALQAPDGSFLVDRFSISHTPSASVYAICAARESRYENRSLVLATSDPRLPHAEAEARSAASLLPSPLLLIGDDNAEAALRSEGQKARFIHIATHGYFRQDNPLFSAIRLGSSFISLLDLYSIPLEAELITLSGCSTGISHVGAGDELLGLTRGLLQAGAHSMLVTLWDVHDDSTARFMGYFYSHLRSTRDKAAALRLAQMDLKSQSSHPYFWGAFTLVGKYAE